MRNIFKAIFLIIILGCFYFFVIHKHDDKKIENLMPDLSNYSIEDIKNFALENNLKLEIEEVYIDNVELNTITNQSIKVGDKYKTNDILNVSVVVGNLEDKKNKEIQKYRDYNVNELGRVPVMMYHGIHDKKILKQIIQVEMSIVMDIKEQQKHLEVI